MLFDALRGTYCLAFSPFYPLELLMSADDVAACGPSLSSTFDASFSANKQDTRPAMTNPITERLALILIDSIIIALFSNVYRFARSIATV